MDLVSNLVICRNSRGDRDGSHQLSLPLQGHGTCEQGTAVGQLCVQNWSDFLRCSNTQVGTKQAPGSLDGDKTMAVDINGYREIRFMETKH